MVRKRKATTTTTTTTSASTEPPAGSEVSNQLLHAVKATAIQPTSTQVSFKEMQRLHAMRMELFGFGGWLASALFYVLFLVWAYVPEATLEANGFTYFPSKHWAVAVPSMIVVTYLFSLVLYKAVNLLSTPGLGSYATILDTHTVPLPEGTTCFEDDTEATPGIGDISIFEVNRHLFSSAKEDKQLKEE